MDNEAMVLKYKQLFINQEEKNVNTPTEKLEVKVIIMQITKDWPKEGECNIFKKCMSLLLEYKDQ